MSVVQIKKDDTFVGIYVSSLVDGQLVPGLRMGWADEIEPMDSLGLERPSPIPKSKRWHPGSPRMGWSMQSEISHNKPIYFESGDQVFPCHLLTFTTLFTCVSHDCLLTIQSPDST
jgi:hypothetical protein